MVPEWCGTAAGLLLMAAMWLTVIGLAVWGVGRIFPTASPTERAPTANGSPEPALSAQGTPAPPDRDAPTPDGRDTRQLTP